jgi:hypothetical protein
MLFSEKSQLCDSQSWNRCHPRDISIATETFLCHSLLDQLANAAGIPGHVPSYTPQPLENNIPRRLHRVCDAIIQY